MSKTNKSDKTQKSDVRKSPLLLVGLVSLIAGAVAGLLVLGLSGPNPTSPSASQTGTALIGGPFSLVNGAGTRVTEKDFAGRPLLVYFGFTNCPDVCPAGLQVIAAALDKLGPKADGLSTIFITLDPERDTPAVMSEYVKSFSAHIMGLSGTPDEIAKATKAYRVYARKTEPDANGNYSVDHSTFMYLMNGEGAFVKHFAHTVSPDDLAQELNKLL